MAEITTVRVIVARDIHGEGKAGQWRAIGYTASLEEAWAALDMFKERERDELHGEGQHPAEREYDVWAVAEAFGLLEQR